MRTRCASYVPERSWNPRVQWWVTFEWPSITRTLRRDIPLRSSGAQRSCLDRNGMRGRFLNNFRNLSWVILGIRYYWKCRGMNCPGKNSAGVRATEFSQQYSRRASIGKSDGRFSHKRSKDTNFGITSKLLAQCMIFATKFAAWALICDDLEI